MKKRKGIIFVIYERDSSYTGLALHERMIITFTESVKHGASERAREERVRRDKARDSPVGQLFRQVNIGGAGGASEDVRPGTASPGVCRSGVGALVPARHRLRPGAAARAASRDD